jgi:TonB family protein
MLSQMRERRVERKKPKRFVALKKVTLDANQQSHISTAQANLPKHTITQKHVGRSSTAFSVAIGFHVLIGFFISIFVIVDRIEQEGEIFNVSIVTEESKAKRRFIRREAPKFNEAQQDQQKVVIKQPVRTNTAQLPKSGFTIPQGPDTGLDLTTPDVSEGPALIDVNRNFVQPTTTIEPETTAPGFEMEREAPTLLDKLDTPVPDESLSVGNIDVTPEQASTDPAFKIRVEPKYPENAKKANKTGEVILQATIDEKGIPKDIVALTNLGFGLEDAAIAAFKKSSFRPAMNGDTPISKQVQIAYEFKLDD